MTATMKVKTIIDAVGEVTVELEVFSCLTCGVIHAYPKALADSKRKDSGSWVCPNGHSQGWFKSEAEKLRDKLKDAERDREWYKDAEKREREGRQAAERSAAAYKGQTTRLRKRAITGTCAFCNRHFSNVERHVATKHPGEQAESGLV